MKVLSNCREISPHEKDVHSACATMCGDVRREAGEMQVEQGLGSIKWTATVGADEVNVFLEA